MDAKSDPVAIAAITTAGGIIIAYITNVVAKKVQARRVQAQPKDRMEQLMDGYERLIKQKDIEDERKTRIIGRLEKEVETLGDEILEFKTQLKESKEENVGLRSLLADLRREHKRDKKRS